MGKEEKWALHLDYNKVLKDVQQLQMNFENSKKISGRPYLGKCQMRYSKEIEKNSTFEHRINMIEKREK